MKGGENMENQVVVKRINPSGQSSDVRQPLKSATPILQMLFSQIASLKKQVSELAVVVHRKTENPIVKADTEEKNTEQGKSETAIDQTERKVEPRRLRSIFD